MIQSRKIKFILLIFFLPLNLFSQESKQYQDDYNLADFENYLYSDNNGIYTVKFYFENLLPLNFKSEDKVFTVYKNNKQFSVCKVSDLIENTESLEKTVSNYYWGKIHAIYDKGIILETVEGVKIFNFESKKILSVNDIRNFNAWNEKELINTSLFRINSDYIIENYYGFMKDKSENFVSASLGTKFKRYYTTQTGEQVSTEKISVIPPELFWKIDENGNLVIANDNFFIDNLIIISKLFIDETRKLIYASENGKLVIFKYEKK